MPIAAELVSGSYFPVLGVRPEAGRSIDRTDDRRPEAHPVVVLSYSHRKNSLGGAQDVVGRTVLVNNHPMTVIGITPATFSGVDPLTVQALWMPAMMKRQATPEWDRLFDRRAAWMHVFARLKSGVSADDAKAGLQPWFKSALEAETLQDGFPTVATDKRGNFLASTIDVLPAARGLSSLRSALERPLLVLMGGTVLLVRLAALNVASLLLARGAARSREVATRMALGASRRRVTGQLLVEALLLTLAGGLLGLVAAPAVAEALLLFLPATGDLTLRSKGTWSRRKPFASERTEASSLYRSSGSRSSSMVWRSACTACMSTSRRSAMQKRWPRRRRARRARSWPT